MNASHERSYTKQNCLATVMQALLRTIVSLTSELERCGSGGGGLSSVTAKLEIAAATSSSIIQVAPLCSGKEKIGMETD